MAQTAKPPAMVLQELTVKTGCAPPEYIPENCITGTHANEFYYKVVVANIVAKGFGRSKQVAKHDAASKALKILADKGIYDPVKNPVQQFNPQAHRNETGSPFKPAINFIGTLKDLAVEHKLPYPPIFEEISDIGPPHCRVFTYQCILGSMKTQATANTKKQAKQLAAEQMIDKLKKILPSIAEHIESATSSTSSNTEKALKKYTEEFRCFDGVVPNRAAKPTEYSHAIKKLMISKQLTINDFEDELVTKTYEDLLKIFEKLELKHQFITISESPDYVTSLSLSLDTPFAVICRGSTEENARDNLIKETFRILKLFMEVEVPEDELENNWNNY